MHVVWAVCPCPADPFYVILVLMNIMRCVFLYHAFVSHGRPGPDRVRCYSQVRSALAATSQCRVTPVESAQW